MIQVFANVLDNACKYTDEGGQISLVLERRGDRCIVKVADTGIGIDPVELDRLYEAFFQIEARADRQASGLGLGLHLVKRLVEKHGGIVRAQSEGLGRGAEFIIELPTIVAPGSDASECQRVDAPDGVKVLIIDDNIDAALSLRMLLDILGQRAEVAATGEEGLERAQAFRPDTVFVDLRMPGMDGFEVAHGLREQFGDEIRLIALTGLSRDQRKNQAQFSEFDDVIVKPASAQVVLQALGAVSA